MATISKWWVGMMILALLLPCYGDPSKPKPWLGLRTRASTTGLTIFGLRPGDRVSEVRSKLPPGWALQSLDNCKTSKEFSLQDGHDHCVLLTLKGQGRSARISTIICVPVTEGSSLELNGKPIFHSHDDVKSITRKLQPVRVKALDSMTFELRTAHQVLTVQMNDFDRMASFSLDD